MEAYTNKCPDDHLRGYIDGTITHGDMPNGPTPDEVIIYREHPIYKMRKKQLEINSLGLKGGRPYVNARLSRYSGETEIDWIGGKRPDGSSSTGRLQQTHSFPYLGRIDDKVNQYVFQKLPVRENATEFTDDVTRDGKSMNTVMRNVSSLHFAQEWCWIGVDAPMLGERKPTIREKEVNKLRPYVNVYTALEVPDWHFNDRGELDWVKTVGEEYTDDDPSVVPQKHKVVKLWQKGMVTKYTILEKKDRRFSNGKRTEFRKEVFELTIKDVIPFVLVGNPSSDPIAFDDLESINRSIMDLGSVNRANYYNACYPQLVLPESLLARAQSNIYSNQAAEIGRVVVGFKYPIVIGENDPTPFYLMPDSGALQSIREEINSLKADLFETVGLALDKETRQIESADAKAWNFLDVSAVMKARASVLEEAEKKVAEIVSKWDSSIPEWQVTYNRDFDTGNFKEELEALIMTGNIEMPEEMTKAILVKILDRLDKIGAEIPQDERETIIKAIETWKPETFSIGSMENTTMQDTLA